MPGQLSVAQLCECLGALKSCEGTMKSHQINNTMIDFLMALEAFFQCVCVLQCVSQGSMVPYSKFMVYSFQ